MAARRRTMKRGKTASRKSKGVMSRRSKRSKGTRGRGVRHIRAMRRADVKGLIM